MTTTETPKSVGGRIGRAIVRDVIADGMPRRWTGMDAQDQDQVPAGMDLETVAMYARLAYMRAIDADATDAD